MHEGRIIQEGRNTIWSNFRIDVSMAFREEVIYTYSLQIEIRFPRHAGLACRLGVDGEAESYDVLDIVKATYTIHVI